MADMKATNLMEQFVKEQVDDMYARIKEENPSSPICDCENCRLDVLCYVLNRVPPKYTVSSRGVSHTQRELENFKQISADVGKIVMDGIRLISSSKRPNHNSSYATSLEKLKITKQRPFFFFPILSGYVYDGLTFESLVDAQISLFIDGKLAKMLDSTWQNPCKTFKATEGAYNFCVLPRKAMKANLTRDFNILLKVEADGYESVNYSFTVPISSIIAKDSSGFSNYSLKIQDLFLFPKGSENTMERYITEE